MATPLSDMPPRLSSVVIAPLESPPAVLLGDRQELNLLWYGPSTVLVARDADGGIAGAVRLAVRRDERRRHGLITDLQIHPDWAGSGLDERLIDAAESALKTRGVVKIDAVVPDGGGRTSPFYRLGYWPSRKTVVIGWDLTRLTPIEQVPGVTIEWVDTPAIEAITDLVLASYQPYWQWWKEQKEDKKWFRVEYPAEVEPPATEELAGEMRERVRAALRDLAARDGHVLFLAKLEGHAVGLCDARLTTAPEEDNFSFGVLLLRDVGGRRLGSLLLGHALHWLRHHGLEQARITTTSGLDDYDPTVYLYTLAYGGQILGEYLDLVKRR